MFWTKGNIPSRRTGWYEGSFTGDRIKKRFPRFGVEEEELDEAEGTQAEVDRDQDDEEYELVEAKLETGTVW